MDHYWGYTNLWNILDFPSIVFPTGLKCDPKLDPPETDFSARNEEEAYERDLYTDAESFKGAPICLQLVGRRWKEEELVRAGKILHATIIK